MITATDPDAIRDALNRYRRFEECLLRELRVTAFGTQLELEFAYVWNSHDEQEWTVADEPSTVIVRLMLFEWAEIHAPMPPPLIEEPERADWGLTEVALVRLEQAPPGDRSVLDRTRHKLIVEWEGERRIEAVFGRVVIDDRGIAGHLP